MNFHLKSMYLHEVATEEIFCAVTLKNIKLVPEEIANLLFWSRVSDSACWSDCFSRQPRKDNKKYN